MNALEFNAALGGLINSAASSGVSTGSIILTLEMMKLDLVRQMQDNARASKIVPANFVPRLKGNGEPR